MAVEKNCIYLQMAVEMAVEKNCTYLRILIREKF